MRAAVVTSDRELATRFVPIPECGPNELRVRVEACGVCGSDLHAQRNRGWSPNLIPGHEIAGRIDAIGADVAERAAARNLSLGTRVVVEPLATCGECEPCHEGRDSICPALEIAGVHRAGGFAEFICAAPERLHPVDPSLSPAVATLIEPLAVALHAIDRAQGVAGERVLVLGGGTIGLLCAFAARLAGAREVVSCARYEHQRRIAEALGVTALAAPERGLAEEGLDSRFDVVIETVGGSSQTLIDAGLAARPGGRVVILGLFEDSPTLDPMVALEKELTLGWANCYGSGGNGDPDFVRAARLARDHRELLGRLVTSRRALEDIAQAFERAGNKREGEVKVVVVVST
jgi:L-iditol 2-dehydrogenase